MSDPLFVDLYAGDGKKDLVELSKHKEYIGAMGKATQGTYYHDAAWFSWFWQTVAANDRYGDDWFATAYHYYDARIDPIAQADFYLKAVEAAGGWRRGDIWPVVDVERGGQRGPLVAAAIDAGVTAFVQRVEDVTGQQVMLYGGELIRSLGITSRMGCRYAWVAEYEAQLSPLIYTKMGFKLEDVFAWQGVGVDGPGKVSGKWHGYPLTTPVGDLDISATVIAGGGQNAIDYIKQNACVVAGK